MWKEIPHYGEIWSFLKFIYAEYFLKISQKIPKYGFKRKSERKESSGDYHT
jgi:hypothetical protein